MATPVLPLSHLNAVLLCGAVSSDPLTRELPSGEVVHQVQVTVTGDDPATSVPVAVFGGPPPPLRAGTEVLVVGRVRRRFFRAGGATRSRTEVVATAVIPLRQRARAARAAAGHLASLQAWARLDP